MLLLGLYINFGGVLILQFKACTFVTLISPQLDQKKKNRSLYQ